jgi:hypothetical protein
VIPKGSSSVDIVITALANTERLDNKTVVLALEEDSAYRIGAGSSKTVTILGNNLPTVTVKAGTIKPSETGPKAGKFIITRTGALDLALRIEYTLGGTATNGVDYVKRTGAATIAAGAASVNVFITPIDDAVTEGAETVVLKLSETTTYLVGSTASAVVTIADND